METEILQTEGALLWCIVLGYLRSIVSRGFRLLTMFYCLICERYNEFYNADYTFILKIT